MTFDFDWWMNLASFAGIAILAVPAWSLNARKRRKHQVERADAEAEDDSAFRAKTREILRGKHEKSVGDWRPIDQACLAIGYTLLLGASFLRVVAA